MREGPVHIDTHNRPVGDDVLQLLARTLLRQVPDAIIVERDDRLEALRPARRRLPPGEQCRCGA
jgi:uncharacterized protein (UPF0276 family)